MRILLLTTYFRPDVASTGVIMSKLADHFVERGHEVTVLTSCPHYDVNQVWPEYTGRLCFEERIGPMRIIRIRSHVARNRANVFQRLIAYGSFNILSILRGSALPRHDVILVPSPPLSNGVVADIIGRIRGVPFVYNVQDVWPDVAVRAGVLTKPWMIGVLRQMEDYVYRRASGVAVISEGFRSNLHGKGVPDDKISVIPNFIDINFIQPQAKVNSFSIEHDLTDKFVVLFAGNMGFSQGLETVIDAAKLLIHIPSIHFLMVGNGAGREKAEGYLARLNLKNVQFLHFQPESKLPEMYGTADLCVVPLRHGFTRESVPCKLFTIMAAGKATVAAVDQESDTWRLIQRSRVGVCVEPEAPQMMADAILHYYLHKQDRIAAGMRARNCVETKFRPERIADSYLEAMQRAIDEKRYPPKRNGKGRADQELGRGDVQTARSED